MWLAHTGVCMQMHRGGNAVTQHHQMIIGIDVTSMSAVPGIDIGYTNTIVAQYRTILQQAAQGCVDFVVFRDQRVVGRHHRAAGIDVLSLASRLAPEVAGIGIVVAKSVNYTEPFTVSRELATLDFVSGGRAGWHVMSIADDASAQNYGHAQAIDAATRSTIAAEFVAVSRQLWDSWEDDAVAMDRDRGWFLNPHKLHHINHRGPHFAVRGPAITYRPPQGQIVVLVSDEDGYDINVLRDEADIILHHHTTLVAAQQAYHALHQHAQTQQRDIRVLQRVMPVVATSTRQAFARVQALEADAAAHGWVLPPAQIMAGTAAQVADQLALWYNAGAADGFVLVVPELRSDISTIGTELVPELQQRGHLRSAYTTTTLRAHLGLAKPQNRYAGVRSEAFLAYD